MTDPVPADTRSTTPGWPVVLLLGLAVALLVLLLLGAKPWELGLGAKAEAGEKITLTEFVQEGLWWAGFVNLLLCLLLAGTSRWWLKRATAAPAALVIRGSYPAWFWIVLLLIVTGAALIRVPRLSHSLWNDEEYTLRRYVFGYFQEKPEGDLRFRKVDWETSLFYNRGANNHVLFSLAGKTSLKIWKKIFSNGEHPFSEAALRFPAYIAGLFSIGIAGMLMAFLRRPMLGLMAAFFLAIHPWHLRYSVEARGYAFLLLFSSLSVYFLMRAVQSGRWRNWLIYGGCQFAYMVCFPGAVYLAAALNLTALAVIFILHKETRNRTVFTLRFLVANLISAMAFLMLMGPSLRQIRMYLERDIAQGSMGLPWIKDIWSHLAAGIRYNVKEPDVPLAYGLNMMMESQPAVMWLFSGLLPLLVLLGLVRVFRAGPVEVLAVVPFFLAAGFAFLHTSLTGNFLFSWYLIFLLPGLAMAVFFGIEMPWTAFRRPVRRNSLQALCGIGFLLFYLFATVQPRFLIRTHDRQPLRQTVDAIRGGDAFSNKPERAMRTISLGTSCRQLQSYDPRILALDGSAELNLATFEKQMEESRELRIPLLVAYANPKRVHEENPKILKLLENPDQFEHVKTLYGLEEMFSFRVVRYRMEGE